MESHDCKCECDKSCDIGKYLEHSNCKCRKGLVDKVNEECSENIRNTRLVEKTLDKKIIKKYILYNQRWNWYSLYL